MEHKYKVGTGEARVSVSHAERVRLNNKEITPDVASLFLTAHQIPAKVEFSQRATMNAWGTCWSEEMRIILYRHSVWTFLHELAHVLTPKDRHAGMFPIALKGLYLKWKEIES